MATTAPREISRKIDRLSIRRPKAHLVNFLISQAGENFKIDKISNGLGK
ncbi:hypothetical protein SSIN_1025 [Streptococcus sinensis]|uniref:Uncharacterized protein n=1 Tax=Streptococcus sinensis TaxID=176090 RepID=A0A0A0DGC5_9STRE|nr:hypothetical protein SSIN_1025 [Streptococcus sinensis]